MFHGSNFVFVTEFNVFFPMNFFFIIIISLCLHCKSFSFLVGIAQYSSNVPFYSLPTAIFSLLYIFVTTFSVF